MTAPSLEQLRDIHLPPPAGPLPLSVSEMALLGVLLAAAVVAAVYLWQRLRRARPLYQALYQLSRLERAQVVTPDDLVFARGVSQLLRRYAEWRYPQAAVTGLAGSAWLDFLDAHFRGGSFRDTTGDLLVTLPYASPGSLPARPSLDAAALAVLVRNWLRENRP